MKRIKSMSNALLWSVVVTTIVTILSEFSDGFMNVLKALTGHHWITKSLLSLVVFFGVYLFVNRSDDKIDVLRESKRIVFVVLLASIVLFGFFLWHAFFSG